MNSGPSSPSRPPRNTIPPAPLPPRISVISSSATVQASANASVPNVLINYICQQLMDLPIITELKICDLGNTSAEKIDQLMQQHRLTNLIGIPTLRGKNDYEDRYFYRNDYAREYYAKIQQIIVQLQTEKLSHEEIIFILQILRNELPGDVSPIWHLFLSTMRALSDLITSIQKIASVPLKSSMVSSLISISNPNLRAFFQGLHKATKSKNKSLQTIIYQWSREPNLVINGKQWDSKIIQRHAKRYTGEDRLRCQPTIDDATAAAWFDQSIWPLFLPLGISKESAIYLANALAFEGLPANILACFYQLFTSQHRKLASDEVAVRYLLTFDKTSAKMQIEGNAHNVEFSLQITLQLLADTEAEKIVIPLEFKLGLSWPKPEVTTPLIRSFIMSGNPEKINLPGTSIPMTRFVNDLLPPTAQLAQFLEYHKNCYYQENESEC